jgi:hypothetical protein
MLSHAAISAATDFVGGAIGDALSHVGIVERPTRTLMNPDRGDLSEIVDHLSAKVDELDGKISELRDTVLGLQNQVIQMEVKSVTPIPLAGWNSSMLSFSVFKGESISWMVKDRVDSLSLSLSPSSRGTVRSTKHMVVQLGNVVSFVCQVEPEVYSVSLHVGGSTYTYPLTVVTLDPPVSSSTTQTAPPENGAPM